MSTVVVFMFVLQILNSILVLPHKRLLPLYPGILGSSLELGGAIISQQELL